MTASLGLRAPHGVRSRVALALLMAAFAMLASAMVAPSAMAAATGCVAADVISPSTFEGCDGNLTASGTNTDWDSTSKWGVVALQDVRADGTDGSSSIGGDNGKELLPGDWIWQPKDVSNKTNYFRANSVTQSLTDGDGLTSLFLNLSFDREAGNGNANLSFELNQLQPECTGGTPITGAQYNDGMPCRSTGDRLIAFDGAGSSIEVRSCKWFGDSEAGFWRNNANTSDVCDELDKTEALASLNGTAITTAPAGTAHLGFSYPLGIGEFGELVVDVNQAVGASASNPCFNFGSIWLHSRASHAITSNMEDVIRPVALTVASCKIAVVKKQQVNATLPADYATTAVDAYETDTINYLIEATNPGSVALTSVTPVDDQCDETAPTVVDVSPVDTYNDGDTDKDRALDNGETWQWKCKHVVTEADVNATVKTYVNEVTVTGATGAPAPDDTKSATASVTANLKQAGLSITKTQSTSAGGTFVTTDLNVHVGDRIHYQVTVANTGNTSQTINLVDPNCVTPIGTGGADGTADALAVGGTIVYTCSHLILASDGNSFTNTASANGTDSGGQPTSAGPVSVKAIIHKPAITLDKKQSLTADGTFVNTNLDVHVGDTVFYTVLVTNTGNTAVTSTLIDTGCTNKAGSNSIAVNASTTYTCSHVITALDGNSYTNVASATAVDAFGGSTGAGPDEVTVNIHKPAITLDKKQSLTANGTFVNTNLDVHVGDTVFYEILVSNTGNTQLTSTLIDTGCTNKAGSNVVPVNGSTTYTCSHVITAADGNSYTNSASVTATDAFGGSTGAGPDEVTVTIHKPAITLDKKQSLTADGTFIDGNLNVHVGDTVFYEILVSNTGNTSVTSTLIDTGCTNKAGSNSIAVNASTTYTCSHVITAADGDSYTNVASATAVDAFGGSTGAGPDEVTVTIHKPAITLDKKQSLTADGTFVNTNLDVHVGDTVFYEILVSNAGNTALTSTLIDDGCTNKAGSNAIAVNASTTYTCSHVITALDGNSYTNTASATAIDAHGTTVGAGPDQVTVTIHKPAMTISKLQSTTGDGTFASTDVNVHVNDTVHYKVTVTNTGNTALNSVLTDANCVNPTGPNGEDGTDLIATDTSVTYTCSHTIVAGDAPKFTNTASVAGTDLHGGTASAGPVSVDAIVHIPVLSIVKEQTLTPEIDTSWTQERVTVYATKTIYYRFTITNTGNTPLTVTPEDLGCDALDASSFPLAVDVKKTITCSHLATVADANANDGIFTNTARATGVDTYRGQAAPKEDSVDARVLVTLISMDKTVFDAETETWSKSNRAHVGDTIKYTITVTNDGNNPLSFKLDDDRCDMEWPDQTVTSGNFKVYTCQHAITDADPNPYVNTAVLDGTDEGGTAVHRESSASTTILKPDFTVDKMVRTAGSGAAFAKTNSAHVGDTLEYQITVTNTGNTSLTFDLLDPNCGALSSTAPAGLDGVDDVIAVSSTATYTCTHVVAALDANPYLNTVRATGTDGLRLETTKESSASTAIIIPGLLVDKQVRDVTRNTPFMDVVDANLNDTLEYRINYTNTGNVALALTVRDDKCSPMVAPAGWTGTLAVGATASFTCTRVYVAADPSPFVNVASGTGTDIIGGTVTSSDTATVVELPVQAAAPKPRAASRLVPPSGCQRGVFRPYVTGQNIKLVQFYVDGKLAATVRKASSGKWVARLTATKLRPGVHRLVVKVTYTAATGAKPRMIRSTFGVCKPRIVLPAFTG